MMPAPKAERILPDVLHWSAFSPAHKVDLTSHAVRTAAGWWVFDPIPLHEDSMGLFRSDPIVAVVLTNENHERDAAAWSARFQAPIWASSLAHLSLGGVRRYAPVHEIDGDWERIPLPGGAPGETAWFLPGRRLLVFGDALVHLPGRGLEILPDRYCQDPAQLRISLHTLPSAAHAVFAHGTPLLEDAAERIRSLLEADADHRSSGRN